MKIITSDKTVPVTEQACPPHFYDEIFTLRDKYIGIFHFIQNEILLNVRLFVPCNLYPKK